MPDIRPLELKHLPVLGGAFFAVAETYADVDTPVERDLQVSSIYKDGNFGPLMVRLHPEAKALAPFEILEELDQIRSYSSHEDDVIRTNLRIVSNLVAVASMGIHETTIRRGYSPAVVGRICTKSRTSLGAIHSRAEHASMTIRSPREKDERVANVLRGIKLVVLGI